MNKKDVLIKIRHEEERAQEAILAAERERDQIIEAARIDAASLQDSVAESFSQRYKEELDALAGSVTSEEQEIIDSIEESLAAQYEKGQRNMGTAVKTMLAEFVRYIDVKAEEDE